MGAVFTFVKADSVRVLGAQGLDLDLLMILLAYLFLSCGDAAAVVFTVGQGLLIDLFSVGPKGISTILYMSAFGGLSIGSRFFDLTTPKGQAVLVFHAVLIKKILFLLMLWVMGEGIPFPDNLLRACLMSAAATGVLTPFLFRAFRRLTRMVERGVPEASRD